MPITIREWLGAYRQGGAHRELLLQCHRRLQSSDQPAMWIHVAEQMELERQLRRLDQLVADCPDRDGLLRRHPLFGVPFAVKDNIDIAGVPTTAACPAYAHIPAETAAVVARLIEAGGVWMGKTNLDQFATGLVGTRSPYGQCASVFGPDYISGGSSSGSAVAVAQGRVAFALGTDTAGSGRIPAGFNQIVGLKPTPGRVGTSGLVPACRSLDCVSVFALSVEEAGHVLALIEGDDPGDVFSNFDPGPPVWRPQAGGGLRVGVPQQPRLDAGSGYEPAWAAAVEQARRLGHRLLPLDFEPLHRIADMLYAGPWVAERYAVIEALMQNDPQAVDPAVRQVIGAAPGFSAVDAFRAQYALKEAQRQMARLWDEVDVLLVPTAPGHPRFADIEADPIGANSRLGTYTNFVNLLGWCALALPAGRATDQSGIELPFGVTFIAPACHDAALVSLGCTWQDSLGLRPGAMLPSSGPAAGAEPGSATVSLRVPATRPGLPIAVVGAHLSGMPLNAQLTERGARLLASTRTAPHYRLYALPDTQPPKPGMARVAGEGRAIDVEVWELPQAEVGSFLALVPSPLALGTIELEDGRRVHGFLCEAHALAGARDISSFGGWRTYMQSLSRPPLQAAGGGP